MRGHARGFDGAPQRLWLDRSALLALRVYVLRAMGAALLAAGCECWPSCARARHEATDRYPAPAADRPDQRSSVAIRLLQYRLVVHVMSNAVNNHPIVVANPPPLSAVESLCIDAWTAAAWSLAALEASVPAIE